MESRAPIPTGSVALRRDLGPQSSLRAAVSRSLRLPSFTELYYEDPTTRGSAGLSPEQALTYETGYELEDRDVSGGLTLFLRDERNFIDWIKRTPSQVRWTAENIADARVKGLEVSAAWRIGPAARWVGRYACADKQVGPSVYQYKYGPNYSKHLLNSVLEWTPRFGRQRLSMVYKKKVGRPGWLRMDARASWKPSGRTELFIEADNILDKKYEEIEGVPQPGIWIEAGFHLGF
jgi:iron complex outermembrane receptor protein